MSAAPTIAQMLSEVSVTGVAGASAAGSGVLPKSELLWFWPLPLPFEEPVAGAWASLLELDESVLELSVEPELSVLPELSVEPPELSVLLPELSVPLPEPPAQDGSVHELPELSVPLP